MSRPIGDIALQIMWNRLIAVVEEQAQTLLRTAFSSIVREAGDLSAGIFDRKGRMLAQAVTGTPGHVNSMAESVKHFIAHFGLESMKPGDAYITNDPWMGTGHLNDFVITTPCFHKGRLVGLFSCTSHLMDIGGIGFGPDGTDVFMEGLYIPFLKMLEEGKVNETLMAMIRANTRLPIDTVGDVYSLMACNDVGCRRLVEMMDGVRPRRPRRSRPTTSATRAAAAVLAEIAKLPKGSWSNAMTTDGFDGPITLKATRHDQRRAASTSTTPAPTRRRARGINVPFAYTTAYTVFGLGCIVAAPHPQQRRLARAADRVGARGLRSSMRPSPRPCASATSSARCCPTWCSAACAQAIPDRVPAEGTSCLWNIIVRGRLRDGAAATTASPWRSPPTAAPARGRTPTASRPPPIPSGVKGTPVEIAEAITPLIFWRKELRPDSGGAGPHARRPRPDHRDRERHRRAVRAAGRLRPHRLSAARPRTAARRARRVPSPSRAARSSTGKGTQWVQPGERLVVMTPGGGGLGAPGERDRALAEKDQREERT